MKQAVKYNKAFISMTCVDCGLPCQRFGKHRNGLRRFRCAACGKTYTEPHKRLLGEMTVPQDKALLALQLLVEGNSIRSTERVTGIDRNTIMKLLVVAGEKCANVMARLVVNVPVQDVECDEIWSFIRKKEGHKGPEEAHDNSIGDAYCFVGIERNSKLVLNFALGRRDIPTTQIFVEGLRHCNLTPTVSDHDRWFPALSRSNRRYTWGSRELRATDQSIPAAPRRRTTLQPC